MMKLNLIVFLTICLYGSCDSRDVEKKPQENNTIPGSAAKYRFLALGDSYTIGQGVEQASSFPYQLHKKLLSNNISVSEPRIVSRTGWTCDDLMAAINAQLKAGDKYDMVSLLIGVNDQYRGYNIKDYTARFKALLVKAIELTGNQPQKVIVISIPDYGATPYGAGNAAAIGKEIDAYNAINKAVAEQLQCNYVDITPISRTAKTDPELVASDELHPSGKMYGLWIEKILPFAVNILK
jgi:acyl-CoA thioesterase-1